MACQRIFNGRLQSDSALKHLVIDRYDRLILLTTYHHPHFEQKFLDSFLNKDDLYVVWRERDKGQTTWHYLRGEEITEYICEENGQQFKIKLGDNQNVGLFLDMAHLRDYLQKKCSQKKILNLFAYTCSLSVAALAGNAKQVTNVDMKSTFLNWGKENHKLNSHNLGQVTFLKHNILKSLNSYIKKGPYDLIIIDPPTFQPGGFKLKQDYPKILKRVPEMLSKHGEAFICSNDPLQSMEEFIQLVETTLPTKNLEHQPLGITDGFDGPKMIRYINDRD